jgi:protein-disulfide isomerase
MSRRSLAGSWRRPSLATLACILAGGLVPASALPVQTVPAQAVAAITAERQIPRAGAEHPDVVIVEYLDYNCPYCRKSAPELHKLLARDPGVQILYKEWPIFGGVSVYAARCALAANWQGKFLVAHEALIGSRHDLDQNSDVDAVLRAAGLDMRRLEVDRRTHAAQIDAVLTRSTRETQALGVPGTPVFLVGRDLITSSVNLKALVGLVALVRTEPRSAPH